MKIRSVEVPHEDGTESIGSDTLDSSQIGMPHPNATQQYEKTIGSFAAAMTELHTELRDKTVECEALYETARSLSHALRESDDLLQEKTLECERLLLKLQMVTFVELSDEPDHLSFLEEQYYEQRQEDEEVYTIPKRPAAILDHVSLKHGGKKATSSKQPKPEAMQERKSGVKKEPKGKRANELDVVSERVVHFDTMDEANSKDASVGSAVSALRWSSSNSAASRGAAAAGPVCVDDCEEAECEAVHEPTKTTEVGAKLSVGPRQAHFYHVILERDMAVQTNRKLTRELKYTRTKVRDLKAKLDRSTTLVELSYDEDAGKQPKQPHQHQPRKSLFATSPVVVATSKVESSKDDDTVKPIPSNDKAANRSTSLAWLRKHGKSVRIQNNNSKECVTFISEDEMLNSNWNKTDEKTASAASEQEYLNAFLSDDADRAGGHVPGGRVGLLEL